MLYAKTRRNTEMNEGVSFVEQLTVLVLTCASCTFQSSECVIAFIHCTSCGKFANNFVTLLV